MRKYSVSLQTWASTVVTVEAEDAEQAVEKALEGELTPGSEMPTICAQCAGWGGYHNLDLGDTWEPSVSSGEPDTNCVMEVES